MATYTDADLERADVFRSKEVSHDGVSDYLPLAAIAQLIADVRAEQREADAKLCEERARELEKSSWNGASLRLCAQLIRSGK